MTNLLLHFSKSEIDDMLVLERGEGLYVWLPLRILEHRIVDRSPFETIDQPGGGR